MTKTVSIYTLSDINENIRYIGKTKNILRKRLYAHIFESINSNKSNYKSNWIKSLLNKGERPIINIIDEVPEEEWEFWEEYWISQFKSWGFNLTNLTKGGEGGNGYKHTDDSKRKMRKSKLGTKLSVEQRKKISESVKLKAKENPLYNRGYGNSRIHLDREELYQKYIIENLSLNNCASFFGVSKKTVFTNITEYGYKKDKNNWKEQLSSHTKKIVLQYGLSGNFIKEWLGLDVIQRETRINKSNIANCCRGISKSAGGYIWKYKE